MAEGDLERIVFPARPPLEQEFSLLADDEQLGRLARAAGEFHHRINDADVEMGENDGELFERKRLALPAGADLPRAADDALSDGLNGRSNVLHSHRQSSPSCKKRKDKTLRSSERCCAHFRA